MNKNDSGYIANKNRDVTIQQTTLSNSAYLLGLVLFLFLVIEIGIAYWLFGAMNQKEKDLKMEFESYKIATDKTIVVINSSIKTLSEICSGR